VSTAAQTLAQIAASCGDGLPLPPSAAGGAGHDGAEPVFAAPWQAQVFAMTVVLHERGLFTWPEWAQVLSRRVRDGASDGSDYYECWAAALQDLLSARDVAGPDEVDRTTQAWHDAAARTPHGQPIELHR
jgi:nitrile hydratase accessory protein